MLSRRPPSTRSPSRSAIGWWTTQVRHRASRRRRKLALLVAGSLLLIASARCGRAGPSPSTTAPVLRVGVGQIAVKQLVDNLTVDGLLAIADDGRVKPWLAKGWTVAPDGLSLVVSLRPDVRFHDGSAVSASRVAYILRTSLKPFAGPVYDDISSIDAAADDRIEFRLKRPSRFVL